MLVFIVVLFVLLFVHYRGETDKRLFGINFYKWSERKNHIGFVIKTFNKMFMCRYSVKLNRWIIK